MKYTWEESDLTNIYGLWIVKQFKKPIIYIEKYVHIVGFDPSLEKGEKRLILTNIQDGMVLHYNENELLDYLNKQNFRPLKLEEKLKILKDNHREL